MSEQSQSPVAGGHLVEGAAAELALGSLGGAERSLALAHIERCAACREEVAQFSRVSDGLLMAAPELEPPVGFEERLLSRLHGRATPGRTRTRRLAAAAVFLVLGSGLGAGAVSLSSQGPRNAVPRLRLASVVAGGTDHGVVALESGHPARLDMRVSGLSQSYWVSCVVSSGTSQVTVGSFELHRGAGQWSVALPANWPSSSVARALLVGEDGAVVASASFGSRPR